MYKQIIALVILSIAVVFGVNYAQHGMQFLINAHEWVAQMLKEIFAGGRYGNLVRGSIALLSIPFFVGLIPALFYWMTKRHWFPYFMQIIWVVWLLQAGALALMYKVT